MSRTIIVTIEIEDVDYQEAQLYNFLNGSIGDAIKDIKTLPDTRALYDTDKHFRTMVLNRKRLTEQIEKYIQYKRHG